MQEIKLYTLEEQIHNIEKKAPYIIVGAPCPELRLREEKGYPVLAELSHLQGLSEEAVADALCKEPAVGQYKHICIRADWLPQAYLRRIWCRHLGEPVLIAETRRLVIRESVAADGEAFKALYGDAACRRFLEQLPLEEESLEAYQQYITNYARNQYGFFEYGMWSVVEKKSGRVIGRMGLENQTLADGREGVGLGYALLPEYRGAGYALEACRAILEYGKECDYAREILVKIDSQNQASRKMVEKLMEYDIIPLVFV